MKKTDSMHTDRKHPEETPCESAAVGNDEAISESAAGADEVVTEEPPESPLEAALRQSAEYLDALQRLKAEFDNYRKRMARDRQRSAELYQSVVLETILPTLDSFDAALMKPASSDAKDVLEGLKLIYNGLMDNLAKLDFQRMNLLNTPFDPEKAEALMTQPTADVEPGTVIGEISAGYTFRNTVLRPARVVVSCAVPDSDGSESSL